MILRKAYFREKHVKSVNKIENELDAFDTNLKIKTLQK